MRRFSPMTCPQCRAAALHIRREDYAYTNAGYADVELIDCEVGWCSACGTRGAIMPCHEQLMELLATGARRVAFDESSQRWSESPATRA